MDSPLAVDYKGIIYAVAGATEDKWLIQSLADGAQEYVSKHQCKEAELPAIKITRDKKPVALVVAPSPVEPESSRLLPKVEDTADPFVKWHRQSRESIEALKAMIANLQQDIERHNSAIRSVEAQIIAYQGQIDTITKTMGSPKPKSTPKSGVSYKGFRRGPLPTDLIATIIDELRRGSTIEKVSAKYNINPARLEKLDY